MTLTQNNTSPDISQPHAAMIAGYSYLFVFILGIFASFFAFEQLVVAGDPSATANNILTQETLFRLGIAAWVFVIVCDTIIAWALYILLKPVSKSLAQLSSWFRLVFVAIFAISFIPHLSILQLISQAEYLKSFETNQINAQIMLLLETHNFGVHISYVFFGLHILLLGYLILKSGFIPRILGFLLIIASFGYLINSFGNIISSEYANNKMAFIVTIAIPAIISELSFTIWLLVKGVKHSKMES